MAWVPRFLLKRRNVLAALFLFGVLYMMRQLLSLSEVNVALMSGRTRSPAAAVTVTTGSHASTSVRVKPAVASANDSGSTGTSHVRGVAPHDAAHYIPGKTFKCLHSLGVIGYVQVNDDYCDCDDGSDEPGTNACPNGRFYCQRHSTELGSPVSVMSMRVNDGICDCCDGSDEWAGAVVPPELQLSEEVQARAGVFQAPCKVRC